MIIFNLPWPPSVNSYWRTATIHGSQRTLISAKGRAYTGEVKLALRDTLYRHLKITERVSVVMDLYPPDNRTRDVDNHIKAVFDSITKAGLWEDDSLVDRLIITRREVERPGRVTVGIEDYDG